MAGRCFGGSCGLLDVVVGHLIDLVRRLEQRRSELPSIVGGHRCATDQLRRLSRAARRPSVKSVGHYRWTARTMGCPRRTRRHHPRNGPGRRTRDLPETATYGEETNPQRPGRPLRRLRPRRPTRRSGSARVKTVTSKRVRQVGSLLALRPPNPRGCSATLVAGGAPQHVWSGLALAKTGPDHTTEKSIGARPHILTNMVVEGFANDGARKWCTKVIRQPIGDINT